MSSVLSSQPNKPSQLIINLTYNQTSSTSGTKPALINQQRGLFLFFLLESQKAVWRYLSEVVHMMLYNANPSGLEADWDYETNIPAQIPCVYTFDLIIILDFDPSVCWADLFIDVKRGGHYPSSWGWAAHGGDTVNLLTDSTVIA